MRCELPLDGPACAGSQIALPCPGFAEAHAASCWAALRSERAHHVVRAHVVADRLQALEDPLPLRPIELAQEGPETLDKWILENRFAIRLGHEKAIQSNAKGFSNLLESAEAGRHLTAFNPGQIGT